LVWNVSASAPVGLYAIRDRSEITIGEMALARMPAPWREFAARRHYIPANVPLVKRVAAAPGDHVCAAGPDIFINNHAVAKRRAVDGAGRAMPWWHGCITLRRGALLLLIDDPASFDGRYFGVTGREDVVGKSVPIWTR
jgi:conjugative transfer signal peptidase TraF